MLYSQRLGQQRFVELQADAHEVGHHHGEVEHDQSEAEDEW